MPSLLDRGRQLFEERTGRQIIRTETLGRLEESLEKFRTLAEEGVELAWRASDYAFGRPQELLPHKRRLLAERSRFALHKDPLAGAEADLLANFGVGKGIPMPTAKDPDVQEVIREAWEDANNEEKLTGFEAQRHRSYQLITDANLFPCFYLSGGRIRVGFLDTELVDNVVMDPEDDERVLWYVVRRRKSKWDFEMDREDVADVMRFAGQQAVFYYAHWRNLEDAMREREDDPTMEPVPVPPERKRAVGVVYHVRINRIGRSQWGTPPWARQLRFFSAMNHLTEAHVDMARAASSIIAKRTLDATPDDLSKAANAVLSQAGEIASTSFRDDGGAGSEPPQPPIAPGSIFGENTASNFQPVSLQSGSAQMAQTAQIVRAPIAAASQFGQHYLGDATSANLAGAVTLELPTLMNVQAWQQTLRGMLDVFTLLAIQAATRAGRLGGGARPADSRRPLDKLMLSEAADRKEAEGRTGKEMDWSLEMPYPGRRNLPDVVTTFTSVLGVSGLAANEAMLRQMLQFLFTHGLQVDDAATAVEDVMQEQQRLIKQMIDAQASAAADGGDPQNPAGSGVAPGAGGVSAKQRPPKKDSRPDDTKSEYGEKRRSRPPERSGGAMGEEENELVALTEALTVVLGDGRAAAA